MRKIKDLIKEIIPKKFLFLLTKLKLRLFGIDKEFKNMSNKDIFNKIYMEGHWGKNVNGEPTSGSGSHMDEIIKPYISRVTNFLVEKNPSVIVDLGCGDFNVGRNFVDLCDRYVACDVSSEILKRNKKKFFNIKNVEFHLLDLTSDFLPRGDVAFVRQVLQHLSNSEINSFLEHININKPYKYLVITESLPTSENFIVNLDKRSGAYSRLGLGSGLVIHENPFQLNAVKYFDLLEVNQSQGRIKTTIYEFKTNG